VPTAIDQRNLTSQRQDFDFPPSMSDKKLTVLFGTMTGNAEDLATQIQEKATEIGYEASLRDLAEYSAESLSDESEVAIVILPGAKGIPRMKLKIFVTLSSTKKSANLIT
jgi:sulfite reductase alpha subunit-like flavoprotein